MKAQSLFIIGLAVLIFFGVASYRHITFNMNHYGYDVDDALTRYVFYPFIDTVWSPNYSEVYFSKIRLGMTEKEVISLLGEPIRRNCDTSCEWMYSWHRSKSGDFDWRSVTFNEDGTVHKIRRSFFVD